VKLAQKKNSVAGSPVNKSSERKRFCSNWEGKLFR